MEPSHFRASLKLPSNCFNTEAHRTFGLPDIYRTDQLAKWRLKERLKTVHVALVVCLNIGVDPPDAVKVPPCAKLECWMDPLTAPQQKNLEALGNALKAQYEKWQPRARYKQCLDPTVDDVKKACVQLRRSAKDERVLFHYNGHGVPRPTTNGEIWVFNKSFTQYIPLSVYDLHIWMGTPSIYVFDCSAAGRIINTFAQISEQRERELERSRASASSPLHRSTSPVINHNPSSSAAMGASIPVQNLAGGAAGGPPQGGVPNAASSSAQGGRESPHHQSGSSPNIGASSPQPPPHPPLHASSVLNENILLASCGPHETLPTNPDFPADLFTACLTTPLKIALQWHYQRNRLLEGVTLDMVDKIPGRFNDRRTPIGELNWIFTAITDTIAWNVLPRDLFQKLFRQDLLVASLFRNFLLAERIMRSANCTPMSFPQLPITHTHPMWQAWDLAVDTCISQLPNMTHDYSEGAEIPPDAPSQFSNFFAEQLTAFEVWLDFGSESRKPPEQLPIVLQVLLSQVHRLRALNLLGRFLDMGPWAVNLALSVGIFPYVLKLLQSPAAELREVLVFIWAKILALDRTCQSDLVKDGGHTYFIGVLVNRGVPAEQRAMACFVLSVIVDRFPMGQTACLNHNLMLILVAQLKDENPRLRKWACLCLSKLLEGYDEAKSIALRDNLHERTSELINDSMADVRASVAHCLRVFVSDGERNEFRVSQEIRIAYQVMQLAADGSPLVRKEMLYTLCTFVKRFSEFFIPSLWEAVCEEEKLRLAVLAGETPLPRASADDLSQMGSAPPTPSSNSSLRQQSAPSPTFSPSIRGSSSSAASAPSSPANFQHQQQHHHPFTRPMTPSHPALPSLLNTVGAPLVPGSPPFSVRERAALLVADMCRIVFSMVGDPFPQVHDAAYSIADYIRTEIVMPKAPPPPAASGMSHSSSSSDLSAQSDPSSSPTMRLRSLRSPMKKSSLSAHASSDMKKAGSFSNLADIGSSLPPQASSSARRSNGMMSPSSTGSLTPGGGLMMDGAGGVPRSISRDNLSMVGAGGEHYYAPLELPVSLLYEWCCEDYSRPVLRLPSISSGMLGISSSVPRPMSPSSAAAAAASSSSSHSPSSLSLLSAASALSPAEMDDPARVRELRWRQERNDAIIEESILVLQAAGVRKLEDQIGILDNESEAVMVMKFHAFEPLLVVSGEKDTVNIWNWEQGKRVNELRCGGRPGARVSSIELLSEYETPLLLLAGSDGDIRVFRDYEKPGRESLSSAFRAVPDIFARPRHHPHSSYSGSAHHHYHSGSASGALAASAMSSMSSSSSSSHSSASAAAAAMATSLQATSPIITTWQQVNAHLFTGGEAPSIHLWDLHREQRVQSISTQAMDNVTSMSSSQTMGHLLSAGFSDGTVRLYDRRMQHSHSMITSLSEHKSRIVGCHMQRIADSCVITGSLDGEIKLWDIRTMSCIKTIEAHRSGMTAMAVHDSAPILASGSSNQFIKVFNLNGDTLSMIYYHDGFLGQRTGPVTSLAFHPLTVHLAAGALDSMISIYSGDAAHVGGRRR